MSLISIEPRASEQGLFYQLHQATGLLEQYSRGESQNCEESIKNLLIKADAELAEIIQKSDKKFMRPLSVFEPDLRELWNLYNHRTTLKPDQVELTRLKIHEKGKRAALKHEESWYVEIDLCKSFKRF